VTDFDAAVRDPGTGAATRDSGDRIHPSDAGYQAMANAISLKRFGQ
jgi:lysophospholipase L1-like esterase